jgi:inner membrane protein
MMTLSHLAISGVMTGLILGTADPVVLVVGAIAGLLPDVDISQSPAGRLLPPISRYLEKRFPHRSCTHSLLASVVVAIGVYGLAYGGVIPRAIAHAIEIGYSFGYLVDLMTKSGIQLFFPATLRCVVPGNRKLRLATGSNWEYAILGLVVALGVLVLSINTRGGLASTFNEILATPRGIQEILSKYGNTRQIIAQVEGVRMLDRARVSQSFGVLEQRDGKTFILYDLNRPEELYQVGSQPEVENQIMSERITGRVGRSAVMRVEMLSWADEEVVAKLEGLRSRYPGAQMYLTGSIEVEEGEEVRYEARPDQLVTVVRRGNRVELNSCPVGEAIGVLNEQWGTGQLRVRIVK